jgi:hypothetical protein
LLESREERLSIKIINGRELLKNARRIICLYIIVLERIFGHCVFKGAFQQIKTELFALGKKITSDRLIVNSTKCKKEKENDSVEQ